MIEINLAQPIILSDKEAKLLAILRQTKALDMLYGQCTIHIVEGQIKKVDKNEAVFFNK
jgi:hypothetical protein